MAFLAHLTDKDIGNVIMMSGTSLTMCFKASSHHDIRESIHISPPIWSVSIFILWHKEVAEAG